MVPNIVGCEKLPSRRELAISDSTRTALQRKTQSVQPTLQHWVGA
jgi:hypothetical protein